MSFKKKYLLLTFFIIIIIQSLLYTNNRQSTSIRYLKWTIQEISIGKLITISFFSGLIVSTLLNNSISSYEKNTYKNIGENDGPLNNEDDVKSHVEMPPQRDIRDAQPTISVNYRVVKNTGENDFKRDQNYSDNFNYSDDWENDDNEW